MRFRGSLCYGPLIREQVPVLAYNMYSLLLLAGFYLPYKEMATCAQLATELTNEQQLITQRVVQSHVEPGMVNIVSSLWI